ncbi:hypothetical protein GALL_426130 [mine drainage metagenome]|uniref:Cation transport ATPase n=1 Tax=mine drainage metagenome TaxID=410659 RepID=A0A1J5Q778_9ZZZZ
MFTWISKARVFGVATALMILALGGCDAMLNAPQTMSVAEGAVVIAGPTGFCVDPDASHDNATSSFVLLGSCASIAQSAQAGHPTIRAVLTAAVSAGSHGASISGNEAKLAAFFRAPQGRAALSRSGKAETVKVLSSGVRNGVFMIHARDVSAFPGQSVSPDYWRALFDLNGHIVTLSVMGVPQAPFTDRAALSTLQAFVQQTRTASQQAGAGPTG